MQVERQAVESHLQSAMRIHLDLACDKSIDTEDKLNDTILKLKETQFKLNRTEIKLNYTESQLNDTILKLKETQFKLNGTEIVLNDTTMKLKETQIKLDGTEIKLSDTEHQLNDTKKTTKNIEKELKTLQMQFEEKAINDQKKAMKEKKVMIKRESRDFPLMFVWKIDNFKKHFGEAKAGNNKTINSEPFYTEIYGYKLQVIIYLNGSQSLAKNRYLSLYIAIMKGQYDAILPWPFNRKVKFTLIDQCGYKPENVTTELNPNNDPECSARPKSEKNNVHGNPLFISHEKLLSSHRYVADDNLFLQIEVGPSLP